AITILKLPQAQFIFAWISAGFVRLLDFSLEGSQFLFGSLAGDKSDYKVIFAFHILPTIVFFSAFSALMYHLGIMQKIVLAMAWVMKRFMNVSGAESLSAAGNVFIGQTEAPLLVKPYLKN